MLKSAVLRGPMKQRFYAREWDSLPQSAPYVLPYLPPKARARLDHHGFREQGNKAADDRIRKLGNTIGSLVEMEERCKVEKEELSSSAAKDLKDAIATRRKVTEELNKIEEFDSGSSKGHEDQKLFSRVVFQFEATRKALEDMLRSDSLVRTLKESDSTWEPLDRAKDKERLYILELNDLEARREELDNEINYLKTKPDNESNSVASDHERAEEDPTNVAEPPAGSLDTVSQDEVTGEVQATNFEIEDGTRDVSSDAKPGAIANGDENKPPRNRSTDASPVRRRQELEPNIEAQEMHETSTSEEGSEEASDSGSEGFNIDHGLSIKEKERQGLDNQISALAEKIKYNREKLESLQRTSKRSEEVQLEDDLGSEEDAQHRAKMKTVQQQQLIALKQQKNRDTGLRQLQRHVLSIRAGDFGLSSSRYLTRQMMQMQRIVRMERALRLRAIHDDYMAFGQSARRFYDDESTDDDDDDDDSQPQKTARQNFLGHLERLINNAQMLEAHVQRIRSNALKLDDVVQLREAFELERELERQWLDVPSPLIKGSERGSFSPRESHHFSGRPAPKSIYKRLEEGQFRVLTLVPAPEPHYPIICTLEAWSMKDVTPAAQEATKKMYAALSYFWGSETCNGRIFLLPSKNDIPMSYDSEAWGSAIAKATRIRIRNNLFRALLRLRRHGRGAEIVALWVDYLCINQEDAEERTSQLGRMVNIYSNASNVCIWLGESDNRGRSDEAMEFIATIMDFAVLDRHAHDKRQAKKWYALGELMRDRWFSRRWVVQEVALAKDATVHCGASMVRWSDFADAASLLLSNQETVKMLFDFSEWREGHSTLGDVNFFGASILLEATNKLFRRTANGEIKRPIKKIESLVTSLKTFDAGDPRDLICSVLGIASDTSQDLWDPDKHSETAMTLKVDYKMHEVDVYKEFTKFCVLSSRSLDIICRPWALPLHNKAGKEIHMPSWIPLLSSSEFGVPEEVYNGRKNGEVLVGPAESPNYKACGTHENDEKFEVRFAPQQGNKTDLVDDDDGNTLYARGFRLGKIQEVSARNTGGVILRESLLMGGWEGFKTNTDSVPDPIWRTLVADRDQDGQVPPSWYQRACLRCLEVADTFNNGDLNVGELLQGHSEMLRKYLLRVRNVTWNRCFFSAVLQTCAEDTPGGSDERSETEGRSQGTAEADKSSESGSEKPEAQDLQVDENEQKTAPVGEVVEKSEIDTVEGTNARHHSQASQKEDTEEEKEKSADDETADDLNPTAEATDENAGSSNEGNSRADKELKASEDTHNEADEIREVTTELEENEKRKQEPSEQDDMQPDNETYRGDSDMSSDRSSSSTSEYMEGKHEKLFGICPPHSESGDLICILYGCSVPVILRKQGDYMRLVGEAYVHGHMDGEAVEDFEDDSAWDHEEFRIL